jgi:hypothetical protein
MAKEREMWENDQLDPERKLAEIESAPPSEPEQTPGANQTSSVANNAEQVQVPPANPVSEDKKVEDVKDITRTPPPEPSAEAAGESVSPRA